MKKKLLQEQLKREKAIIENFAKTFNKIKRIDENEITATGMIKENADIKYKIIPENIKSEVKKYILDIFNECETKVSDGVNTNIINGDSYNKGWNLYIKNGKVIFFDDADTVGNPISQGGTTLVVRVDSLNVGKEILQKLGIEYTSENFDKFLGKSFTDYFREKCGDILFELYKRKVNQVRYGGHVNAINEALDVTQYLKVGDRLEKINTASPDTLTIVKIDGNKLFIKADKVDQTFQWTLDSVDDEIKRGKLKWLPKNEAIDEMNISEISKYGQTGILIINLRSASDAMRVKNLLDSQGFDGDGDDAVFAVTYGNGWWEPIEHEKDGNFGVLFSVLNVEEAKKIINMIFTIDSKSPFYELNRYDYEIVKFRIGKYGQNTWEPIEGAKELDEVNIKKGLATLGLAATMMGAPKDAAAQMPQQQGIEKSVSSASALGLPEKNRKFGKEVIDSYAKNPFTADMWSKKNRENLRFFKTIKKLVDYYNGGGQVDYSDIEELGAMAQQSPVAMDFLQR